MLDFVAPSPSPINYYAKQIELFPYVIIIFFTSDHSYCFSRKKNVLREGIICNIV